MENWTEEDLAKLPVKELKSLAKKNNLNPNFKKAELVMVLLNSFKNTADCSGTTIQPQTSKRITRSRVSLWHASNETSDHVKEEKLNKHISDLNLDSKASVDDKSVNKKRKKVTDTMTDFDTAEMFPLVSSIKLTSKPLVIITNSESAATTSKRSKRNKVQDEINNKLDILPSDSAKLDIKALTLNPCLETEISEQDCNLNNTFTVEHGRSASPDNNRKSKKRKRGAGNKEQAKDEQNGIEVGKENQSDCRKDISVAESKSSYEKPTRGSRRRQTESPIEDDVSLENSAVQREPLKMFVSVEENLQDSNKRKKKKGNDKNRVEPVDKILNNTESSPVKDSDLTGPSNSSTDQVNKLSSSNSVQRDDLKKKIRNNSEQENRNQTLETNVISPEEAAKDGKRKRSKKNKKQGRNKTTYSPNTHESTELVEATSSLQRSSRRSQSLPMGQKEVECNNECSSVEKKLTNGHNNSNGNIEEDNVKGETGEKGIQGPIRSSTFIVSDTSAPEESEEMPVPAQKRNSLFILCDSGRKSSHNRSLRFSPRPTLEKKANTSQNNGRLEKSIGQRIMKSSAKLGNESTLRKEQGSAIKKNIVSTRTGSVFKKSPATKMPDFKKIHQQLFNNMESLSDNKKRQQDRAKGLLMSPAPRCAIHTPKLTTNRPLQDSNSKKSTFCPVQSNKVKTPVAASPLAVKLKTPAPSKTPVSKKPVPAASSVNRFGFRKPVKKEDATILVGKKLPLVNLEKKKEQDRNILKGVRMNKRFILQMKMRQGLTSEK